jgi:hypothetical protein
VRGRGCRGEGRAVVAVLRGVAARVVRLVVMVVLVGRCLGRRERNREHAKRSRVRKKFLLESLQKSVNALQEENDKLKAAIRGHLR